MILKVLACVGKWPSKEYRSHLKQLCRFFTDYYDMELDYAGVLFLTPLSPKLMGFATKLLGEPILYLGWKPIKPPSSETLRFGFYNIADNYIYCYALDLEEMSSPIFPYLSKRQFWNLQFMPLISHELAHYLGFDADRNLYNYRYLNEGLEEVSPDFQEPNWLWVVQDVKR